MSRRGVFITLIRHLLVPKKFYMHLLVSSSMIGVQQYQGIRQKSWFYMQPFIQGVYIREYEPTEIRDTVNMKQYEFCITRIGFTYKSDNNMIMIMSHPEWASCHVEINGHKARGESRKIWEEFVTLLKVDRFRAIRIIHTFRHPISTARVSTYLRRYRRYRK